MNDRTSLTGDRLELGPIDTLAGAGPWQHWRLARDRSSSGREVVWLVFDRNDASANSLNEAVLEELDAIIAHLEAAPPALLVLRSGKSGGFCVGADISMFRGMESAADVSLRLQRAHAIVDRLERLPATKLAVVHGPCLGGGLELALACDLRLAVDNAKLGFPEVLLGLHPGLGGSFRSTERIEPMAAMTLMLTGKTLSAQRARVAGLVDAVSQERHIANAVQAAVEGRLKPARQPRLRGALALVIRRVGWLRGAVAARMLAATAKKVSRAHYPAPFALIELWQQHGNDRAAMQAAEIASFASRVTSTTGQNLIRVFFLRERLRQSPAGSAAPAPVRHVHVVGAGTMGGDIAAWCAYSGLRVSISDNNPAVLANALGRVAALCRRRHRSRSQTRDLLDRFIPDRQGAGIGKADLVIEAVPEVIAVKRAVYRDIQARMRPDALLASNTSSIPLEILRQEIDEPERFVGLHFFNPVASMQLVELVCHDQTSSETLDRAQGFITSIDRLPVQVRSSPGFLVNRVLTPYLLEAVQLLDEGLTPAAIDRAARDFGMPMGPAELADRVGLDICLAVADLLTDELDGAMAPVPHWLRAKVKDGETGAKSGKGFYRWQRGRLVDEHHAKTGNRSAKALPPGTTDRLLLPLLNASVSCLREQVVADEDTLDAALIFGTGFAPFTGGPLRYARARGLTNIMASLTDLERAHGERFRPDPGWQLL